VGLAAQESFGNVINGMMITMFKPFEVGDRVQLIKGNITGYIEDITLRHTVIRTFVNSRVIVPNSAINSDMIENSNFLEGRASSFVDAVITYDSDMELAQSIMSRVVTHHPDYDDARPANQRGAPVKVYVRELGLYGVALRISMWTSSIDNNFDACSDVRQEIKKEFDKNGIKFAHSRNFDPMMGPQ
jgi:small-conductance mechanosensitive channel